MNPLSHFLCKKKDMGKGDIKTRKGKLANGSFGNLRRRNETMDKKMKTEVVAVSTSKAPAKAKGKKADK